MTHRSSWLCAGMLTLAAAAALLIGCDPLMSIRGSVHTAQDTCALEGDVYAGGTPIEDAVASLHCPGDDRPLLVAKTDETGHFQDAMVGLMGTDCIVEIEKEGFLTREYTVADLCSVYAGDTLCHAVTVVAELHPGAAESD